MRAGDAVTSRETMNRPIQKIAPFLWFDDQAEEAVGFYTSIFKNSEIETVIRYGDAGPGPKGSVMTTRISDRGTAIHGALNEGLTSNVRRQSRLS